jgi:hypothetical protein
MLKNCNLSKPVIVLSCIFLSAGLVSCGSSSESPAVSQPVQPQASTVSQPVTLTIDDLLPVSAAERIDDRDFLQKFWDEYICYTFISVSNGTVGFDSVEKIPLLHWQPTCFFRCRKTGTWMGS